MLAENNSSLELWRQFHYLETDLNEKLRHFLPNPVISHIYNPVVYATDIHCAYLKKYLNGRQKVLFIGLNPGPNGMVQTGVSS